MHVCVLRTPKTPTMQYLYTGKMFSLFHLSSLSTSSVQIWGNKLAIQLQILQSRAMLLLTLTGRLKLFPLFTLDMYMRATTTTWSHLLLFRKKNRQKLKLVSQLLCSVL